MTVLLVRHVHAGDRSSWQGDDRGRPASERGRRQAEALVEQLAGVPVERALSSEYARCVQTLEPLARDRGLEVEPHPALAEGSSPDLLRRLLRQVEGQDVALCSHGDVIGAHLRDLAHHGVDLGGSPRWPKGSVWILEGPSDAPSASYLPPAA